jgi:hypothetical protein
MPMVNVLLHSSQKLTVNAVTQCIITQLSGGTIHSTSNVYMILLIINCISQIMLELHVTQLTQIPRAHVIRASYLCLNVFKPLSTCHGHVLKTRPKKSLLHQSFLSCAHSTIHVRASFSTPPALLPRPRWTAPHPGGCCPMEYPHVSIFRR